MEAPSYSAPIQPVQTRRTSFGLPPTCTMNTSMHRNQQWPTTVQHPAAVASNSRSSIDWNLRGSIDGYNALPCVTSNSMPLEQSRLHDPSPKQQQPCDMQEQVAGGSNSRLSCPPQASQPSQPMLSRRASVDAAAALMQTRCRSFGNQAPVKRASIDLPVAPTSSRYGDYPRSQQQPNSSRYSIDVGASAAWTHSSLFSSTASGNNATASVAQHTARERRPSSRHSVDVGSCGAWLRSSGAGAAPPVRRSPWAHDGTAAVHPAPIPESSVARTTASAAAAAGYDAGFNAGVNAAMQQQQHRAPSCSPSVTGKVSPQQQQQAWATFASAGSAQDLPEGIMRTSSYGSSSSGGSCSSTYSREQQQQMAMQSMLYSSSSGSVGITPADVQQQHQQQQQAVAALKAVEEEVKHLTQLKGKLIKAATTAPAGSAAAAACNAALAKHEVAMTQALQAQASLEFAAASAIAKMGSLDDMDAAYEEFYAAADEAAMGTAAGTDTEDEYPYYPAADIQANFSHGGNGYQQHCRGAHSSRRSIDVGSLQFQRQRTSDQHQQQQIHLYQQQQLLMEQLQQMLPSAASPGQSEGYQQKLQQLKTLQQMQADLKMMQTELATMNRVSARH